MKSTPEATATMDGRRAGAAVACVIPCYKVKKHILEVIAGIGAEVGAIYVVDDACPQQSGRFVAEQCGDPRVRVLFHEANAGVGGALVTGYRQALQDGAEVIVKLDGDGQMDPALVPKLIGPIVQGFADYTKGNRFYYLEGVQQMPLARLVGNAALSFFAKFSTGYWDVFDPTNGFTAVHAKVVGCLPLDKVDKRYFFESDMLFRLNTVKAVVVDVPFPAKYADEESNLKVLRCIPEFGFKHLRNTAKRIFYNYCLRDFSATSLELMLGAVALAFGVTVGATAWWKSIATGVVATSGTVMLAALPTLIGIQLLLSFLAADSGNVPKLPLHKRL
jgi:dolichol-phosphate mannosyltransferase